MFSAIRRHMSVELQIGVGAVVAILILALIVGYVVWNYTEQGDFVMSEKGNDDVFESK